MQSTVRDCIGSPGEPFQFFTSWIMPRPFQSVFYKQIQLALTVCFALFDYKLIKTTAALGFLESKASSQDTACPLNLFKKRRGNQATNEIPVLFNINQRHCVQKWLRHFCSQQSSHHICLWFTWTFTISSRIMQLSASYGWGWKVRRLKQSMHYFPVRILLTDEIIWTCHSSSITALY